MTDALVSALPGPGTGGEVAARPLCCSAACPDELPRIVFGEAVLSGAVGPGALVEVVQEHLPCNHLKLVRARGEHGADEAHLFIWLSIGEKHRFGRAEALLDVEFCGLDGLEEVDLQGVDTVWVALDASPGHAPDCRHLYPILCHDADGWHDWRMRRS